MVMFRFYVIFIRRFSSFSSGSNGDDILDMRIFIVGNGGFSSLSGRMNGNRIGM